MAKKSKTREPDLAADAPKKPPAAKKRAPKPAGGKKRAAGRLVLALPLAKARKMAGDLYQSASLAIWAEAIEAAAEPERATLLQLQDAICDAADLFKQARAANPQHLQLYFVACFDSGDLTAMLARFVTAASEEEALKIWREAFKGEYGRRKPRARLVPALADAPGLHE